MTKVDSTSRIYDSNSQGRVMSNLQGIRSAIRLMAAAALSLFVTFGVSAQTVRYIHTDGSGSVVLVTDKDRNVVERREYEPYGSMVNQPVMDGPGYTGHVMDAATGLTYMQQRYYDPVIGRFLSGDPVAANAKPGQGFNRYWYGNNSPYKFTDPDGREVTYTYGDGTSEMDGRRYIFSIMLSGTAHDEMRQIEGSSQRYTVVIDNKASPGYDPNTRTISLNPSYGFKIKSSGETQSPKVNGGHEISHAAEHDRKGDQAFGKALERPTNPDGTKGVSPEENRATKVEQKIGRDLSEPTRRDYRDAGDYVRCNPTAATGCK